MIMSLKQRKIKFEPRIKLNRNISIFTHINDLTGLLELRVQTHGSS